jgi:hypothetical protein
MSDEISVAKPRTRLRKVGRGLVIAFVSLLAVYFVARLALRFSGSNQWELIRNENGVKIYTLKQPGNDLKLVKGVVRVRSTLSAAVAWLSDGDTCKESGCHGEKNIEAKEEELQYAYMRFDLPFMFKTRDVVLRIHFDQLPRTKEVWAAYIATPEKEPLHDCCLRITNMSNYWRLTPVGNGIIEMEYVMNMDWGGFFPDPLSNIGRPQFLYSGMKDLQKYVSREKYQNIRYSYIQEP